MTNLVRMLRLRDLFYLFVGSVIGSAIFIAPELTWRRVHGLCTVPLTSKILLACNDGTFAEPPVSNP
jgi:hypothetical protein